MLFITYFIFLKSYLKIFFINTLAIDHYKKIKTL